MLRSNAFFCGICENFLVKFVRYILIIKFEQQIVLFNPKLHAMKRFDQIRELVMSLEGDFEKFYDKGNQAAGTRVRKGMQDLKNLAQEIRIEIQEKKNTEEA